MDKKTLTHLKKIDKTLGKLIQQIGPITLKPQHEQSPYEALVESVVHQQLSGKAAATIFGRVKALFPHQVFPNPSDLLETADEIFRSAGLSRAKTLALKDIAAKTIDGTVPTSLTIAELSDIEIIDRLTKIRGVGQWTVEMLLIFKLGRPDILPTADYGVRKGYAATYGLDELPTPKELLALGEKWKPYRTTASWYLWRAADSIKKK